VKSCTHWAGGGRKKVEEEEEEEEEEGKRVRYKRFNLKQKQAKEDPRTRERSLREPRLKSF
jgi:hypothetical protein